ncbi:MAG: universal stress protein [Betaproteobacteria bacterium]|nr:universal stress protein [Betaproteobacteria bacterium]
MRKVLLALDAAKGSAACVRTCARLFAGAPPKSVILLHVQQLGGGPTLVHDRMGDSEIDTLKEELGRSGALRTMEEKALALLESHRKKLQRYGFRGFKPIVRTGHAADEILSVARDERVELIVLGNTRGPVARLMMGDIVKAVVNHAEVPVLLAR